MRFFAASMGLLVILYAVLAFNTVPASVRDLRTPLADSLRTVRIGKGAELFSRTCQRCHNPRGPAERTDREWVMIMQHMQTRANLTRRQTELVREFLLASNDTDQAPGTARAILETPASITRSMVEAGRLVYLGAGTCFACHGASLEGGPIAPSLVDGVWKRGSGDFGSILKVVRNGVSGSAMAAYPGGITDEQAQRVSAFVWAMAHQDSVLTQSMD